MTGKAPTIPTLPPGYQLGKFEIVRHLARDGQAYVYLARVAGDQRRSLAGLTRRLRRPISSAFAQAEQLCILKLAAPGWIESLRDEHSFLLRPELRHPRIIALFSDPRGESTGRRREPKGLWFADLESSNGTQVRLPYITLTYLPGGSVKDLLDSRGRRPLPPTVAVHIALQIADAIDHLHSKAGIIHHDLSPSNIVLREPLYGWQPGIPDCVLIDLAAADTPGHPRRTQIYGRKTYLPPERLKDLPNAHGPLVDVYGLGVVLYEMLVGQLPRTGTDAITNVPLPLPPIRDHAPQISEPLAALVSAAVDPDPQQRSTLEQLIRALRRTPEAHGEPRIRATGFLRWALIQVAAIVLIVLLLGGVSYAVLSGAVGNGRGSPSPTTVTSPTITPPSPTPTRTPIPATSTPVSQLQPNKGAAYGS